MRPGLGQQGLQGAIPRIAGKGVEQCLAVKGHALATRIEGLGSACTVAGSQGLHNP